MRHLADAYQKAHNIAPGETIRQIQVAIGEQLDSQRRNTSGDFVQESIRDICSSSSNPATVVQRQLEAFNAKDTDALLATYAEDAQMFEHPAKLLASGAAALRERFTARFQEPNLRATLINRMVMGNIVVDHEEVRRTFPEGPGKIGLVMTYEVQDGQIAKAWSIAGEKVMDVAIHG